MERKKRKRTTKSDRDTNHEKSQKSARAEQQLRELQQQLEPMQRELESKSERNRALEAQVQKVSPVKVV